LKIISHVEDYKKNITKSIKKFCYCAEHNYINYYCLQNKNKQNIVLDFGKDRLVLANVDKKNEWELFPNGILAPKEERFSLLKKFLNYTLVNKKAEKVIV